jgi:peptidoglycan hydrolase-like protein with peptidoglycan-binding domain
VGPQTVGALQAAPPPPPPPPPPSAITRLLAMGCVGDDVRTLQDALRNAGFDPGASDGDFGPMTDAALRAFQAANGLVVDGVAGPATCGALGI